ncbi:FcoT family thioesterase [Mycobacteroides salmoniphilum]|uniref:FcoT family thioesterase n=1 Tax=Mycobacteroides salmoniphilum TaxID=404941 RepID=UPI0009935208|nr:FcoT family thioesterase [Mycobacteroides salmoniphilum]
MSGLGLPSAVQTGLEGTDTVALEEDILCRVLEPYSYKGCRYLLDGEYGFSQDSVFATGNFRIDDSAYIRSTGHFNAVELVLCFNQLAYSAFAQGTVQNDVWAFRGWSLDDYCQNQLAGMLIKSTSSRYKRLINSQNFQARMWAGDFQVIERSLRYLQVRSTIEFWDQDGGSATGDFELAVLNIP